MLTEYGNIKVNREWLVNEPPPPLFMRIYYVYSGDVTCFCGEKSLELKHGFLYLFPTAMPYRLIQNPDRPLICTFMHLDISPLLLPDVVEINPDYDAFPGTLLQAFAIAAEKEEKAVLESLSETMQIYLREHGYFTEASGAIGEAMRQISYCKSRMPSIKELSAACGYHPQYFIRKFKREIGMTPHQYMLHFHLREAAFVLKQVGTVSQAAAYSGFSDLKNFEKAFRQKYGMSPAQYKKNGGTLP